jgi:hypothetical protein
MTTIDPRPGADTVSDRPRVSWPALAPRSATMTARSTPRTSDRVLILAGVGVGPGVVFGGGVGESAVGGLGVVDVGPPVELIVKSAVAGVTSAAPPAFVPWTLTSCVPDESPEYATGEAQGSQAPRSSEQRKVTDSSEWKITSTELPETVSPSIVVTGGVVGGWAINVQLTSAGVVSTFPAPSVAMTRKVWGPLASPASCRGGWHAENREPSSEQVKVEAGSSVLK